MYILRSFLTKQISVPTTFISTAASSALKTKTTEIYCSRNLWGYVAHAFNQVDYERRKAVGPDRLCAEWILKNGGSVRIVEAPNIRLFDYNALPPESTKFRIRVIDATNSSIMKIGLEHFEGCNFIDTVIFHNCKHLEEDSLDGLTNLKQSLKELQISSCSNLTDESFKKIGELINLQKFKIFDLMYVKNLQNVVKEIQKQLPKCQIDTTNT